MTANLSDVFDPVMENIIERSKVADSFIDKNLYRLLVAILWTNVVLKPAEIGLEIDDLEEAHEAVNRRLKQVLGNSDSIRSVFQFINSKDGELAMKESRLTQDHKDLLLYFASMILDPEGHRKWMSTVNQNLE
tara:strand:- start:5090 stop:5488 length:399 start_codon:yes stop_codon:yes gene_type:complete